jgi:bifunctional non-homologous end joining protein LigD
VRLFARHGHDFTARFPLAAGALAALPGRSFLIDGEAIVTNDKGLAVFDLIRRARNGGAAVLCAFDLIELDGADLRRAPIEHRKQKLARLVRTPHPGIVLNEHYDGDVVFEYACKLGCEGIVSKRLGSPYRSGRSAHWVKVKNPKAPAVTREAEEDWGRSGTKRGEQVRKLAQAAYPPPRCSVAR